MHSARLFGSAQGQPFHPLGTAVSGSTQQSPEGPLAVHVIADPGESIPSPQPTNCGPPASPGRRPAIERQPSVAPQAAAL